VSLFAIINRETIQADAKEMLNLEGPNPVINLLGIQSLMVGVFLRLDLLVEHRLAGRRTLIAQSCDAIDGVNSQAVTVGTVTDGKLEGCIDVTLLPVTGDQEVLLALAAVCETVDQPGV